MITGALPQRAAPPPRDAGPPKHKNESELWVKLAQLPRPVSEPLTLRAKGVDVGTIVFRVLSSEELMHVWVKAHEATKEMLGEDAKGSVAFEEIYQEQKALGLILLACRQPDDPTFGTFVNLSDVRSNLTDDEASVVLAAYNIFRRESGPIIAEMTVDEMEAWIEVLERGVSRLPLVRCTSEALMDLLMFAVKTRTRASSTATSYAGSLPAASFTPSSESDEPAANPDGAHVHE